MASKATGHVLTQDPKALHVGRMPQEDQQQLPDQKAAIGRRIQDIRRAAGLSQDDLARQVGVDRRTIQRIENASSDPRLTWLLDIARAVGVPVWVLLDTSPSAWIPPASARPRNGR